MLYKLRITGVMPCQDRVLDSREASARVCQGARTGLTCQGVASPASRTGPEEQLTAQYIPSIAVTLKEEHSCLRTYESHSLPRWTRSPYS